MSEKPKMGAPRGGKKLKPLHPCTEAMLAGSIPLPPITDLEFLKNKAVFRSKHMNSRLGDALINLHFATVFAKDEKADFKANFKAMKRCKVRDEKKKEYEWAAEYRAELERELEGVFGVALAQRDQGFFEQVAHALKALEKLSDPKGVARLCVARAWYLLAKRCKESKQGHPTAAAVSEVANQIIGRHALVTPNTVAQDLRALDLPYRSQRMKK